MLDRNYFSVYSNRVHILHFSYLTRRIGVSAVPFSCCDIESKVTPCQHEGLETLYGRRYDTLNGVGCQTAMLDYFEESILRPAASFLICITILEVSVYPPSLPPSPPSLLLLPPSPPSISSLCLLPPSLPSVSSFYSLLLPHPIFSIMCLSPISATTHSINFSTICNIF